MSAFRLYGVVMSRQRAISIYATFWASIGVTAICMGVSTIINQLGDIPWLASLIFILCGVVQLNIGILTVVDYLDHYEGENQ